RIMPPQAERKRRRMDRRSYEAGMGGAGERMRGGDLLPLDYKIRVKRAGRGLTKPRVDLLNQIGPHPPPSRFMGGAEPRPLVALKVLKEENLVAPVLVALEFFHPPVCGPSPVFAAQEEFDQPPRQLLADLPEVHHLSRPGRAFDLEVVAVAIVREVRVIFLQRFDDQEVDREPHRPAPIRVAAEQPGLRLRRLVIYTVLDALDIDPIRIVLMEARKRADAVR